jgi:hypothetical protein
MNDSTTTKSKKKMAFMSEAIIDTVHKAMSVEWLRRLTHLVAATLFGKFMSQTPQ